MAKKTWCIPKLTDEFRERMEDVLDQYEKPLDAREPLICLDEQPYQLLDHTCCPQPSRPGRPGKQDYEYRRCGTCSLFVAVEPKAGKRFVQARRHRKRADFARFVRDLLQRYPNARRIHLVLDNLNTHNAQSLVQTFGRKQAHKLLKRIVWHHTPKHASWLNMAEIEIAVLTKQCLDRRLGNLAGGGPIDHEIGAGAAADVGGRDEDLYGRKRLQRDRRFQEIGRASCRERV